MRVRVVGAGPVGLAAADNLSLAGCEVTVVHRDPIGISSASSVGPAAAGLVEPVAAAEQDAALVDDLLGVSLPIWMARSAQAGLGAELMTVKYRPAGPRPPSWVTKIMGGSDTGTGVWEFMSVVITPSIFLPYFVEQLASRGVRFVRGTVTDLRQESRGVDLIVNASGPGAYALGDSEMFGRRGVLVWVNRLPGMNDVRFNDERFCYAIPQAHRVALGGTRELAKGDPAEWARHVDRAEADRLLDAGLSLYPDVDLTECRELAVTVDYRPCRSRIRLELDTGPGVPVIHAVGLGGSGWTLAPAVGEQVRNIAALAADLPGYSEARGA